MPARLDRPNLYHPSLSIALALLLLLCAKPLLATDFAFLHTPPDKATKGQDLVITGSITNAGKVRKARLRYRRIGERSYEKIAMNSAGGDRYTAVIPGRAVAAPGIEYFVVIQDVSRQPHLIYASPDKPARVKMGQATEGDPEDKVKPKSKPDKPDRPPKNDKTDEPDSPGEENPFETPEEKMLRTGEVTDNTPDESAMPILPPVDDDTVGLLPGQDPDLLDEFAVFAAEDSTSLAASYSQKTTEAPAILSVVSRQRIAQMGARTLLDILKPLPGVETRKDISGFDHVSFRGVRNDAEILLLVDGHRWNNFYDGRPYWAIPAEMIERVEVIRGPGSALYGTSAFMGVINVVTRETSGFWADAGFGSFITPFGSVGGGFSAAGFNLYGAADLNYSNGPAMAIQEDSFTSKVLEREERDLKTNAWGIRGGLALKADYNADFGGKFYARTQGLYEQRGPYMGRFDTAGPDSNLSWLILSLDAGYRHPFLDSGSVDVRLYGDQHSLDQTFQLTPHGFTDPVTVDGQTKLQEFENGVISRTAYSAQTVGAEARVQIPIFDVNRLVIGSQLEFLRIPNDGFILEMNRDSAGVALTGLAEPKDIALEQRDKGRLGLGVYLQDEWQIVEPLFFTLGVRFSYFSDVDFDPMTHITPRVGLVWEIVDDLNLKLLGATAFRAPTFEEKYDQTSLAYADLSPGVHLGNPDLLPEFLMTGEGGLSYDFTFAGFRYRVGGNLFAIQIRDAIDRIDDSGTQELLLNSGIRNLVGTEFDGRVEFTAGSYLYTTFGWFRSWHEKKVDPEAEEDAAEEQEPTLLTADPQYRLNIGANLEIGELADLHLLTMFGGERRNNVRSPLESLRPYTIPAYALVNVSIRTKPLFDMFGFEFSLYNALDYPYKDDVPRPDRVPGLLPREGVAAFGSFYLEI